MAKDKQAGNGYVKEETMLLVAFIALALGFICGVVFTVYKSGSSLNIKTPQARDTDQDHDHPEESDKKISALEQEINKNPENIEAWIKLGNICFDANKIKKAIRAYEKALELNPGNANVLTDLGVMYRRDKQPEKAVEVFDKAMTVEPHHEVSRFNKGIVLMHDLKDYEGAIREWNELVKLNPMAMTPGGQTVKEMVERIKKTMNQQKNG